MGGARRQDAEAALACEPIPLLPERGLADPRIALEQQCLPAGGHSPQKPIERQQLLAPADELAYHRTLFPRAITPGSASRAQITSGQSADEADNRRPQFWTRSSRATREATRCRRPPRPHGSTLRVVATGGNRLQMHRLEKARNQAKTIAVGCDQLPQRAHGKEGVDGYESVRGL